MPWNWGIRRGFYAEYAAVKAGNASVIPSALTMEQAAALPSDALTALIRVRRSLCRESRGRRAKPLAHGY